MLLKSYFYFLMILSLLSCDASDDADYQAPSRIQTAKQSNTPEKNEEKDDDSNGAAFLILKFGILMLEVTGLMKMSYGQMLISEMILSLLKLL